MSYIGNTAQNINYVPAIDYFNGDGSTVAFTLSRPVASVAAVQAVISNVPQNPGSAFTVSGSTITFTSAPPSGTANIYVYYTSPNTQVVQPGQGTVGATQVGGNYALWNKSGSDINYTAGNVGVGTSSPRVKLEVDAAINAPTALATAVTTGANGNFVLADNGGGTVGSQFGIALNSSSYDTYIQARNMGAASTPYNLLLQPLGGNVGIGTSSPTEPLSVTRASTNQDGGYVMRNTTSGYGSSVSFETIRSDDSSVQECARLQVYCVSGYSSAATSSSDLAFFTQGAGTTAERMRINSSGNLLVGTTSAVNSAAYLNFKVDGDTKWATAVQKTTATNVNVGVWKNTGGSDVGTIVISESSTAYNTSSDYRLKENIQPMQNALATVAQLNPVTYTWKVDGSDGQGFIAHELQAVVPDCVTGEKDAVDAEGKPVYQGIDTSFLVATLTAAIQELSAKVDAQAAEIAALKGQA